MGSERRPEIAFRHLCDVLGVLHRKRSVEAEFVQQSLAPRRIHSALAGEVLDRIAWYEVDQREREQRHADEGRDDQCRAAEDEGEHGGATNSHAALPGDAAAE